MVRWQAFTAGSPRRRMDYDRARWKILMRCLLIEGTLKREALITYPRNESNSGYKDIIIIIIIINVIDPVKVLENFVIYKY